MLLRGERLDRLLKLLRRRDRLEQKRDDDVVFVGHHDRSDGVEDVRRGELADHENVGPELPRSRDEP